MTGLGLVFGRLLLKGRARAFRWVLYSGMALLALFVVVRGWGGWGDFHPPNDGWTARLTVTKYPPSAAFLAVTLGIDFLLLTLFSCLVTEERFWDRFLLVLGRTALFFYIVHLYLYGLLGFAFPEGVTLPVMYLVWLLGLVVLYPLCVRYGEFKRNTPIDSVWRMF